jgi:very-short-patch-repair endonuclease
MRGPSAILTERARALRRRSTRAELVLWRHLRDRPLAGCKFVRQEPIGPYFADFVCRERHLVLEVDGGQHADSAADAERGAARSRIPDNSGVEQRCSRQYRGRSRNAEG